eukprot:1795379-Pyramimonas_sp.AAC.1
MVGSMLPTKIDVVRLRPLSLIVGRESFETRRIVLGSPNVPFTIAIWYTGAINLGLDFEDALTNPEYIKMEAAAQVSHVRIVCIIKYNYKCPDVLPSESMKSFEQESDSCVCVRACEQLRLQLKKFAKSVQARDAGPGKAKAMRPMNDPSRPGYKPSSENPLEDVEGVGIDTSVKAVAIRVAVVVLVSILGFVGLFVFGLQFFD